MSCPATGREAELAMWPAAYGGRDLCNLSQFVSESTANEVGHLDTAGPTCGRLAVRYVWQRAQPDLYAVFTPGSPSR